MDAKKKRRLSRQSTVINHGVDDNKQRNVPLFNENDDEAELRALKEMKQQQNKETTNNKRKSLHFHHSSTSNRSPPSSNGTDISHPSMDNNQLRNLYSLCIKLASSNKITTKNVWGLSLIDHMDEVIINDDIHENQQSEEDNKNNSNINVDVKIHGDKKKLNNSANDEENLHPNNMSFSVSHNNNDKSLLNFQKASATLDASVMIYSSRVDAVHKDTFKVLGGLNRGANKDNSSDNEDNDDEKPKGEAENEDNADDDADNRTKSKRTRRNRSGANTLETNLANINHKVLDRDYECDPLFHKMSAVFDEGGARGLLMNHLSVYEHVTIAFDSHQPLQSFSQQRGGVDPDVTKQMDLRDLAALLPSKWRQAALCPSINELYDMRDNIINNSHEKNNAVTNFQKASPSLESMSDDEDDNDTAPPFSFDLAGDTLPTLENAMNFDFDSYDGGVDLNEVHEQLDDAIAAEDRLYAENIQNAEKGELSHETPTNNDHPSSHVSSVLTVLPSDGDRSSSANWAGFKHWKFRNASTHNAPSSAPQKVKKTKQLFFLDFFSEIPESKLFKVNKKKSASNVLTNAALGKVDANELLLPEDIQYRARNLQTLFHQPHVLVKLPTKYIMMNNTQTTTNGENPNNNNKNNSNGMTQLMVVSAEFNHLDSGDAAVEEDALQFQSADDDDDNAASFHMAGDENVDEDDGDDFAMTLLAQPQRVEKINLSYTRVAKRVDVRALKECLWNGLMTKKQDKKKKAEKNTVKEEEAIDNNKNDCEATESISFQRAINELSATFPSAALSSVSVPYCFICLLHLANEKNLYLTHGDEPGSDNEALTSTQASADRGYNLGDFAVITPSLN